MSGKKVVALVVGLVVALSCAAVAQLPTWFLNYTSPYGTTAFISFVNQTGQTTNVLHLEFARDVTLTHYLGIGGTLVPLGKTTGKVFDLAGEMVRSGEIYTIWAPVLAEGETVNPLTIYPVFAQWLAGTTPAGSPFIGSIQVLGRLFGEGIAALRESNPAALAAAFDQFFADNAAYLSGLSASLGMDLASQLMPVIMSSPAEGIANFFSTIVGMLGVTSVEEVLGGDLDFSALFAALGL
jgi:hypothetical protein